VAILYVTDQGAVLLKQGNRLVVQKLGKQIRWVHAFKVDQVVIMGNVSLSPGVVAFLLGQGIDTVFLSYYGKYRGRLISQLGKNIELRRLQFRKMEDPAFRLTAAQSYVRGKIANCRVLLRRQNADLHSEEITASLARMRALERKAQAAESVESLMGVEGSAAAAYFGCFGRLLRADGITFDGRNRRPPRDPVNVLLSLGYTLLANAVETQVNVAGLDPYLGCLHSVEYGRPSLVLDLMEEFRPVLVDSVVVSVINRRIVRALDFFRPQDREPAAFDFAEVEPIRAEYPILLGHEGMKKFVVSFEERLNQKTMYLPRAMRLSYRDIILEQVRLLVRTLQGEDQYVSFSAR